MNLHAVLLMALPIAACPAFAADVPKRVAPDRAAMAQSISTPLERSAIGDAPNGQSPDAAPPARKGKRVRHTIPAPKRM